MGRVAPAYDCPWGLRGCRSPAAWTGPRRATWPCRSLWPPGAARGALPAGPQAVRPGRGQRPEAGGQLPRASSSLHATTVSASRCARGTSAWSSAALERGCKGGAHRTRSSVGQLPLLADPLRAPRSIARADHVQLAAPRARHQLHTRPAGCRTPASGCQPSALTESPMHVNLCMVWSCPCACQSTPRRQDGVQGDQRAALAGPVGAWDTEAASLLAVWAPELQHASVPGHCQVARLCAAWSVKALATRLRSVREAAGPTCTSYAGEVADCQLPVVCAPAEPWVSRAEEPGLLSSRRPPGSPGLPDLPGTPWAGLCRRQHRDLAQIAACGHPQLVAGRWLLGGASAGHRCAFRSSFSGLSETPAVLWQCSGSAHCRR